VNKIVDQDEAYLSFENLSKVYATRDGEVRALTDISLTQRRGEFLTHVGPSGCGKSTLLMIAAGLVAPSSGAVRVRGQKIGKPRTDIGIAFQSSVLLEWRTALGNVMLQAEAHRLTARKQTGAHGNFSTRSGSAGLKTCIRMSYRVACASAFPSAARSSTIRSTCSWTSRSARSTL